MNDSNKTSKRKRSVTRRIVSGLGIALMASALTVGVMALLAPQQVEQVYGNIKVSVGEMGQAITKQDPTITLGQFGGKREIDWCNGEFIGMSSYEHEGVPVVYAAHNNCGGDVILGWELGQKVQVTGSDQLYEVIDIRYTQKTWSTVDELVGLQGEFALQSCFYGENRMKFVGLAPAAEAAADPAE